MYELIVLGLIPGTQMQITFTTWLIVATILCGLIIVRSLYRSRGLRRVLVTLAFSYAISRVDRVVEA